MAKKKQLPPTPPAKENISAQTLDDLMGERFGIYAKDVIQDRAIPDARDGMKPVQRRIIFDMWKTGNTFDKPTKKSAHIVGDVMGNFHPHGDASIYDALAHLSQDWRLRYPLVIFQGNNGSMDGDSPAAPRYTEAKMSALANELVRDIDKGTVDMELTYDDSNFEPTVLPAHFPSLLVNGSEGIAVGLATAIPPHNLREVTSAVIYRIKHPDCEIDPLLRCVPGPDFPTGGIIIADNRLRQIYETGRGRATVSSRIEEVVNEDGSKQLIVTEIPFGSNKSELVGQIDKIRHDKVIPGIEEVRDETDRKGLRIAIDLKPDAKSDAIRKYLLAKTGLMQNYSANMVAIVDGRPKTMTLISYCDCYIAHQREVTVRRSKFILAKDEARHLIVTGLIKAVSMLDKVVAVIKRSADKADSKLNLQKEFGFTESQSEAIVMMPLYKLSHTDMGVLEEERLSLEKEIAYLKDLLGDSAKIDQAIIADISAVAKKYGDKRRTEIKGADAVDLEVNKRDLIVEEDVYLAVTRDGYLKRSSLKSWKGSGGQNGSKPGVKPGDVLLFNGRCKTIDFLLMFTNLGNYLYIPVHEVKEAKWNDEGYHVNTLVSVTPEERIVRCFAVRVFRGDLYVVLLTKHGLIKRIQLSAFPVVRRARPISAIKLSKTDELVGAALTSGDSDLFIVAEDGSAVLYNEDEIMPTNPHTGGIKAGAFKDVGMAGLLSFNPDEKGKLILLTDRGCARVYDLSHIGETGRLDKTSRLYSMFKSEPHRLVYLAKVGEKALPFILETVLASGESKPIVFGDFHLTPMDKYCKRPSKFPSRARIAHVASEESDLVDSATLSFPPRKKRVPHDPVSSPDGEKTTDSFEQISLFDDDDGGEKK
ncbi:MAG: DNA topoisomerase (ATP-hydrolyzing) subunit A [Bacilli bacterium]|jgi:topoisomerase-4 subunit A|nr:DNA topoisomerase (ATP-hydrolyzing) subunit A [Bacilli bacterium]